MVIISREYQPDQTKRYIYCSPSDANVKATGYYVCDHLTARLNKTLAAKKNVAIEYSDFLLAYNKHTLTILAKNDYIFVLDDINKLLDLDRRANELTYCIHNRYALPAYSSLHITSITHYAERHSMPDLDELQQWFGRLYYDGRDKIYFWDYPFEIFYQLTCHITIDQYDGSLLQNYLECYDVEVLHD